ncbi:fungal-specific transcription factor domain-containing protein [Triangularia verruculosa]|uniref:Fungal-specific transcription factor domain-containing protein n=1 Tax=Triangularia verruculosa TaxID=2587418 RepID=A0AAN6XEV9_9PEZI|nr:fungal-specific transcription factor domain-containing protein [Triangularia verruculosa]
MAGSPSSPGPVDSRRGANARRPAQRSSIACQSCRKSKIKCNNTGGDSPCDTCIRNGKECTYPEAPPVQPKRSEPPAGPKAEQGTERKRVRRMEDIVKMEGAMPAALIAEDVLSVPYLNEAVWSQLFDIYRLHFATELPFLHLATLKEKLGSRFRAKPSDTSPEINLVLLGILTLTARFHQTLVSYVTVPKNASSAAATPKPQPPGPDLKASVASEYYAEILTKALGGLRTSMTVASVERVQAFLMLGLYEWSQAVPRVGGMAAWMYVGVAIRMAQALGLGHGDGEPRRKFNTRTALTSRPAMPASQMIIAKEIRRRTMFSCLILDRLLGCGKDRVSTIRSEDLRIQLPCAEMSFDLSEDVYTGFLNPIPGFDKKRPISDSVLGRFVRLVILWGEISRWSFSGGRFIETEAPWNPASKFYQLREKLEGFYGDLPPNFQWCDSNYYKHENHQASSVYVSLHMLGAVCRIMLHREYIPFIPIRCDRPIGPLDEPVFAEGQEPAGFWNSSAEEIFRAARDIVDLVEICGDKLPMSALVLFSVWTSAFVGIYAVHFPHMDTKGHMVPELSGDIEITKNGPTGTTFATLKQMSRWLKLAETYCNYFREMACYYEKVKSDWDKHGGGGRPGIGHGGKHISVRLGGGGLEEWRQQAPKITNNGEIIPTGGPDGDDKQSSRDSTTEPSHHHSHRHHTGNDHMDQKPSPRSTSFTPINSAYHPSQDTRHPNGKMEDNADNWRFHPHNPHQQHQQPSPSQSSTTIPSPEMPMISFPALPLGYIPNEIVNYVAEAQSMPWFHAPGGIDQFAHGTKESETLDNGNLFWGSIPEAILMGAGQGQMGGGGGYA